LGIRRYFARVALHTVDLLDIDIPDVLVPQCSLVHLADSCVEDQTLLNPLRGGALNVGPMHCAPLHSPGWYDSHADLWVVALLLSCVLFPL
jgi:hypothetical protein